MSPFLDLSLKLAQSAKQKGNHPFGAVLVFEGEVILTAENEVTSRGDVTAHAELLLVKKAQKWDPEVLKRCILYSSTEPCMMCAGAIYWSGIRQVVFGCSHQQLTHFAGPTLEISAKELLSFGVEKTRVENASADLWFQEVHRDFWSLALN